MSTELLPKEATVAQKHTEIEKETMRRFCEEWIHDRDDMNAAIRIGITNLYAKSVAMDFLSTAYCQNYIKELTTKTDSIVSDDELLRQELIRNLLSILKKDGADVSQAARIAAAKQISDLMGLSKKVEVDTATQISNVMICPAPLSIDDWSKNAQAQQAELYKQLEASL